MKAIGIVPAAGSGERFGGAKLLAGVDGGPLIARTVASLLDGGVDEVIVALGPDGEPVEAALADLRGVRVVLNPDPSRGMLSSIQAALGAVGASVPAGAVDHAERPSGGASEFDAFAVLPGDMPFVAPGTVRSLLHVFQARGGIVSPRHGGKRGHPVLLPRSLRDEILAAPTAWTLHTVLAAHRSERVDVDLEDAGVLRDVDTRSDLGTASERPAREGEHDDA